MKIETRSIRLRGRCAAPAPADTDADAALRDARGALPAHIDAACWAWTAWLRSRGLFAPSPRLQSPLGNLGQRPLRDAAGGADARLSAELQALNLAIVAHQHDREYPIFWAHYVYRPASVKAAAARVSITPKHWYSLRNDFARRVYAAGAALLGNGQAQAAESVTSRGNEKTLAWR